MTIPLRALALLTTLLTIPLFGGEGCGMQPVNLVTANYLDRCLPTPVSAERKSDLLQTLPQKGEITRFTATQRTKLDAVQQLLATAKRNGIYEVRVVDVPEAWTGLYESAVLLLSAPVLAILNAKEIQALAAHEAGHEYLAEEYKAARLANDTVRLHSVETACDAIAVMLLNQIGESPENLASAIRKTYSYNRDRFGVAVNEATHPTARERAQFIREFARTQGTTLARR